MDGIGNVDCVADTAVVAYADDVVDHGHDHDHAEVDVGIDFVGPDDVVVDFVVDNVTANSLIAVDKIR